MIALDLREGGNGCGIGGGWFSRKIGGIERVRVLVKVFRIDPFL